QLLSTEENCLIKGSAVSKSSNVRGRGLSISVYYIILAVTNKGDNCRFAPAESTSIDMPACHLSLLSFSKHEPTRQTLLYNPDPLLQKYYNSLKKFSTKSSCDLLYLCLRQQQQKQQKNRLVTSCTTGSLASWAQTPRDTSFAWVVVGGTRRRTFGQFNVSYSQSPKKDGDQLQLSHFISIGEGGLTKRVPTVLQSRWFVFSVKQYPSNQVKSAQQQQQMQQQSYAIHQQHWCICIKL
ncbi:hypothetical protein DPMN_133907, partial [Dreissena polymorpha]